MNNFLISINQFWMRRTVRERWFLGGGAVLGVVLMIHFFWILPAMARMTLLDRLIPQKENELLEFSRLRGEYLSLSHEVEQMKARLAPPNQFSPLSFLEEIATRHQVRKQITTIRPLPPRAHELYREVPIEIKLDRITLSQAVPFLAAIEQAPYLLRIRQLTIKTQFSDPTFLDVTVGISSYEKTAL